MDKVIKDLKEENTKLKEELEWKKIDLQKEVKRNDIDFDLHEDLVNLLKGEIEELKEGIKELKEENDKMTALAADANGLYEENLRNCVCGKSI
jgi:gas vesicle protein